MEISKTPKMKNAQKTLKRAVSTVVLTNSALFLFGVSLEIAVFAEGAKKSWFQQKNTKKTSDVKTGPRLCYKLVQECCAT